MLKVIQKVVCILSFCVRKVLEIGNGTLSYCKFLLVEIIYEDAPKLEDVFKQREYFLSALWIYVARDVQLESAEVEISLTKILSLTYIVRH